jgi:hypothetical protein
MPRWRLTFSLEVSRSQERGRPHSRHRSICDSADVGEAGAADVRAAVSEMVKTLTPRIDAGWSVAAGSLDWSCRDTLAHVAHDLIAYAVQVAARSPESYLPLRLVVRPEASPGEVIAIAAACGTLLADAVAQHPDARAWHWGSADTSAFAAMGIGEVLVHTYDIAVGLGIEWSPPTPLAELVIGRVLPEAPDGPPAEVLLWATGRRSLGGAPPAEGWVWRAAR